MTLAFDHTTLRQRVLFASGAAKENAVVAVNDLGSSRLLLIHNAFAASLADSIAAQIPVVTRIGEVVQHVPIDEARSAINAARDSDADGIIVIGGGSSTGLAKIVALETGIPIIAVPTTFAGSEATNLWGRTEGERKITGVSDRVLPAVVIYDATLMAGMPSELAVASALNAAAHAIDSFWAPKTDPINTALGGEGLNSVIEGLRMLRARPGELAAVERVVYGAYLAAVAFASAGSGLHHKICHALGGTYRLPHAQTHSVMLPYVTALNAPAAPAAAARISAAVGAGSPAQRLSELIRDVGAPSSLRELGFREIDIPQAVDIIMPTLPRSNPRAVTPDDLCLLLHAAWAGDPILEESL